MKKYLSCLLATLLLVGCGTNPTGTPVEQPVPEPDNYLYEVKDDVGNTMYLLGTIDYSPTIISIDGNFKEIYDQCGTIALSVDLNFDENRTAAYESTMQTHPLKTRIGEAEFNDIWFDYLELYPYSTELLKEKMQPIYTI